MPHVWIYLGVSVEPIFVRPAQASVIMGGIGEATLRRLFDEHPQIASRAFARPGAKTTLIRVAALHELALALAEKDAALTSTAEPAQLRKGRSAHQARRDPAAEWIGSSGDRQTA